MDSGGGEFSAPGTVQLVSGLVGLNGACTPIAKVGNLVHNSFQFDPVTGTSGYPYGTIQDGSSDVFTC